MEVKKGTQIDGSGVATAVQLEAINAQAKGKLTAEQVYVFSLRLCGDQVDRDMERFDTGALPASATSRPGRTSEEADTTTKSLRILRRGSKKRFLWAAPWLWRYALSAAESTGPAATARENVMTGRFAARS